MSYPRTYPTGTGDNKVDENDYNAIVNQLSGFSASGTFKSPYGFVVVEDGTDAYACNAYQVVYGGPSDSGAVDGGDWQAVIDAAFSNLTGGRDWYETVVIVGDYTLASPGNPEGPLQVPSYTIVDLSAAMIKLDGSEESFVIENDDNAAGNTHIKIIGGVIDGNETNQAGPFSAIRFQKMTHLTVWGTEVKEASFIGISLLETDYATIDGAYCHDNVNEGIEVDQDCTWVKVVNCTCNTSNVGIEMGAVHYVVANNFCTANTNAGIESDSAFDGVISGNVCENTYTGILVNQQTDGDSENIVVVGNNTSGNSMYGIYMLNVAEAVVVGNYVCDNTEQGIWISNLTGCLVADNFVQGNTQSGIYLLNAIDTDVSGNYVEGNGLHGIQLSTSDECTLQANYSSGNTQRGFSLTNADNCFVDGNTVKDNTQHGIYLYTCTYNTITGNFCVDNDSGDTNSYNGIDLRATSTNNFIAFNTCRNVTAAQKQRYGISNFDANCTNNVVVYNNVDSNRTANIYTGTATITIRYNTGYVTENSGLSAVSNGDTIAHGLVGAPDEVFLTVKQADSAYAVQVSAVDGTDITIYMYDIIAGAVEAANKWVSWYAIYKP